MRVFALYPSVDPEAPVRLGPYTIDVAVDGPPELGHFPIVVISHGSGGSPLTHRLLALHLAREGWLVLLLEHPGNNRDDNSLADTAAILEQRPRDVRAALDWAASPEGFGSAADTTRVGVVGHSLGGYTALALAGGRPTAFARETAARVPAPVDVAPDERVGAIVLMAPATPWFTAPGALSDVRVPILMFTGEHDRIAPPQFAAIVREGVPGSTPIEHRVVGGASHYAFLAPFPPEMVRPGFPPAEDRPGFDRAAFHRELYPQVAAFLRRHLG